MESTGVSSHVARSLPEAARWRAEEHSALLQFLTNVTSPDPVTQQQNLVVLEQLARWEAAPYALLDVVCHAVYPSPLRLAAALVFKQLVRVDGFASRIDVRVIEAALVAALGDAVPEVRTGARQIVSVLLQLGGLEAWPTLLPLLRSATHAAVGSEGNRIHGDSDILLHENHLIGIAQCFTVLFEDCASAMCRVVSDLDAYCLLCDLLQQLVAVTPPSAMLTGISAVAMALTTGVLGVSPHIDSCGAQGTTAAALHVPPSYSCSVAPFAVRRQQLIDECCRYLLSSGVLAGSAMPRHAHLGHIIEFVRAVTTSSGWSPDAEVLAAVTLGAAEEEIRGAPVQAPGSWADDVHIQMCIEFIADLVEGGERSYMLVQNRISSVVEALRCVSVLPMSCAMLSLGAERDADVVDREEDVPELANCGFSSLRRWQQYLSGATDESGSEASGAEELGSCWSAEADTGVRASSGWLLACLVTCCPGNLVDDGLSQIAPQLHDMMRWLLSGCDEPGIAPCEGRGYGRALSPNPPRAGEQVWWRTVESSLFLLAETVGEVLKKLPGDFLQLLWQCLTRALCGPAAEPVPHFVRRQCIRCASRVVCGLVGRSRARITCDRIHDAMAASACHPLVVEPEPPALGVCEVIRGFVAMCHLGVNDPCKAVQWVALQSFQGVVRCMLHAGDGAAWRGESDSSDDDGGGGETMWAGGSIPHRVALEHIRTMVWHVVGQLNHYQLRQRALALQLLSFLATQVDVEAEAGDSEGGVMLVEAVHSIVLSRQVLEALRQRLEVLLSAVPVDAPGGHRGSRPPRGELLALLNCLCNILACEGPEGGTHVANEVVKPLLALCGSLLMQCSARAQQHGSERRRQCAASPLPEPLAAPPPATAIEEDICMLAIDVASGCCGQLLDETQLLQLADGLPSAGEVSAASQALANVAVLGEALRGAGIAQQCLTLLSGTSSSGELQVSSVSAGLRQSCFGLLSDLLTVDRYAPLLQDASPTSLEVLLRLCMSQMGRSTCGPEAQEHGAAASATHFISDAAEGRAQSNAYLCLAKLLMRMEGSQARFGDLLPGISTGEVSQLARVVTAPLLAPSEILTGLPTTMKLNVLYSLIGFTSLFADTVAQHAEQVLATAVDCLPLVSDKAERIGMLTGLGLFVRQLHHLGQPPLALIAVSVAKLVAQLGVVPLGQRLHSLHGTWVSIIACVAAKEEFVAPSLSKSERKRLSQVCRAWLR